MHLHDRALADGLSRLESLQEIRIVMFVAPGSPLSQNP
jgi:hypothetical protein